MCYKPTSSHEFGECILLFERMASFWNGFADARLTVGFLTSPEFPPNLNCDLFIVHNMKHVCCVFNLVSRYILTVARFIYYCYSFALSVRTDCCCWSPPSARVWPTGESVGQPQSIRAGHTGGPWVWLHSWASPCKAKRLSFSTNDFPSCFCLPLLALRVPLTKQTASPLFLWLFPWPFLLHNI